MKFFPYDEYKDSGVQWLSLIPAKWNVIKNKQVFTFVKNLVGTKHKDFTLLSLTLRGIEKRDIESGKGKFPAEFDTYQKVKIDNLVFCLFDIDETPRTVGISTYNGMITGAYNVACCLEGIFPKFIYYYYLSIDEYKGLKPFYTGLRKVVRPETFMNLHLGLPQYKEQQKIADFLDKETAKIDTLIEKQKRLIQLLEEKRQAVISHAVTKGLNPNVKMKDSGVEWAELIPFKWNCGNLRWFSNIYAGGTPSKNVESYWENGTIPWLNSGSVNQALIKEASAYITQEAYNNSSAKWIKRDSLVMALAGQGKTKGMVAQMGIDATCNQSMAAIVPSKHYPRFLYWWLYANYQNIRNMAGGDLRDGLNLELLADIKCLVPPKDEQIEISTHLDNETSKIDLLILKSNKLIKLSKERRAALISAAVTGKIDVRNIT